MLIITAEVKRCFKKLIVRDLMKSTRYYKIIFISMHLAKYSAR